MKRVAAIVGTGMLAELVYEELTLSHTVDQRDDFSEGIPDKAEIVLVLADNLDGSVIEQAETMMRGSGIPWLRGVASPREGVIGPMVRPGAEYCSKCADRRRNTAGPNSPEALEEMMNQLFSTDGSSAPVPDPPRMGLVHMAHLIAAETERVLQGDQSHLEEHLYIVQLRSLKTSLHFFLPDPLCPVCSPLSDDTPEAAKISLKSNPKTDLDHYRTRPIRELEPVLRRDYLDARTGLFNQSWPVLDSPFANVSVNLPTVMGSEITGGRSHSFADSELIALLEGLERYCGFTPRGKKTAIRDSYRNLAEQALHPLAVGVYSSEQYALPDFPYQPFDPDRPIDWVWGYSFGQNRSILVPRQLAYYSWGEEGDFVKETSNGCAIGGSLEEAILYGILEIVERDSFLMTWYASLRVPRLDPRSVNDRELQLMLERMRVVAGYDVRLYNTTTENGIPSIGALAKNRNRTGPHLVCAAGAHLDPVRAVKGAIHELSNTILMLSRNFEESREACEAMYEDSSLVRGIEDHSLLYGLPQAEERLQFLLDESRPMRSFDQEYRSTVRHADLTDDLQDVLQRFRQLNLDVIVVDQTSLETLRNGLYCVKVIIPGMLPITFGHHLRRLTGLERVFRVPAVLGYKERPLTVDELSPHPHPFP
ncbi:TOMM precursor leader peptide-binding protein [Paenibacillus sp. HJGM_3]|uniref:TOMM precursor leader peptide-binding protein n=1 Tax=Paenibacillus sp. HJGM_3 TaxID=3379816 RepID=UPI00385DC848